MDRMIRGDREAFETFVSSYTDRTIRQLIARFNVSTNTAEELTQEAFAEIWAKIRNGAFDTPDKRPRDTRWLAGYLHKNLLMYLREKHRRDALTLDEVLPLDRELLTDPSARRPQSILDSKETQEIVERMWRFAEEECSKLTGKTREIFDLVRHGLSVADAGRRLGMNANTCNSHFQRARRRIIAIAEARALGWRPPVPPEISKKAIQEVLSRLPNKHQRKIASLACFDGLSRSEIVSKTGYSLEVVETNLEQVWEILSEEFQREFPEVLEPAKR